MDSTTRVETTQPHHALALADEALKRANAATPGPWRAYIGSTNTFAVQHADESVIGWSGFDSADGSNAEKKANAKFIANARTDVPALATAVHELVALDNPEFDGTDAAHPAWWRGHHQTTAMFCHHVQAILDKRDVKDESVSMEPWHTIRQRLLELVTRVEVQACTINDQIAQLESAQKEADKWRRIRKNTHGPCCQCQHCGQDYDDCRCDLDEVADELEQAKAQLGTAVPVDKVARLTEAAFMEGVEKGRGCNAHHRTSLWFVSDARAAVERLRGKQ